MNISIRDTTYESVEALRERLRELDQQTDGELLRGDDRDEWNEVIAAIEEFETRAEMTRSDGGLTPDKLTGNGVEDYLFERKLLEAIQSVRPRQSDVFRADEFLPTTTRVANNTTEPVRSLSTTNVTTSAGVTAPALYEYLRPLSIGLASGIQTMPIDNESVTIPLLTAGGTASWVAEGTAAAPNDPIFGSTVVTPTKLSQMTQLSNEVIEDSNPDVLTTLRNEFLLTSGAALDRAIYLGTGASNQPLGMHFTSGVSNQNIGTFLDFANWAEAVEQLETANAPRPYSYAAHPAVSASSGNCA